MDGLEDQAARHKSALIIGALSAALIGGAVGTYFIFEHYFDMLLALGLALFSGFSAWICIYLIWVPAMRRKETRKRGVWMGLYISLLAFVLTTCLFFWSAGVHEFYTGVRDRSIYEVLFVIFAPLFMTPITFCLGGFLSLPAGAILGHTFSRNPDPLNTHNP